MLNSNKTRTRVYEGNFITDDDSNDPNDKKNYKEEWIREHIKRRECSQFIEDPNKEQSSKESERQCCCGYRFSKHSTQAQKDVVQEGTKWDYRIHSVTKKTNAFGHISFVRYYSIQQLYVRMDVDTKMSDVCELLFKRLNIRKPRLLISVLGGTENNGVSKSLRNTLQHGLTKIIQTEGTWTVTGGTHAGVPKHIGDVVMASGSGMFTDNIAIAIVPWGCLQNQKYLINKNTSGTQCDSKAKGSNNKVFLDPNYTHFILVDNATKNMFGAEIPFQAKLVNEIVQFCTRQGKEVDVSLPSIQLVCGGYPGTLENVHQAIENNTPTVVVKSSCPAADILAYAYLNSKEGETEATDSAEKEHKGVCRYLDDSVKSTVENMIKREFGEKETMTHLKRICDCLKKSDLLSVYEMEVKGRVNDFDVAILQALFKANKYQVIGQINLALVLNRSDVAESVILNSDKNLLTEDLYEVMFLALQQNRVNFVRLFLDQGVSLKLFLTKTRLLQMYKLTPKNCLLCALLMDSSKKKVDLASLLLSDVETVVRELLGGIFYNYDSDTLSTSKAPKRRAPSNKFEQPFQHLFIWSILMLYQDMAKLCWAEGEDAIATALVAYNLLKSMLVKARDQEDVKKLTAYMNEWSDLATGVLCECHSTSEKNTRDLLVREQSNWGNTSCMLLAGQTDNKDFISQNACQSLINGIWNGGLDHDTSRWRLLLCLICPFLAFVLLDIPYSTTGGQHSFVNMAVIFSTAPVVNCLNNFCSYLGFLSLYAYILIFNFDKQVSLIEIFLIIWVVALATEEVRQVVMNSSTTLAKKWHSYITDTWNKVDTLAIVVFIIGIILRFLPFGGTLEAARVVLALNFVTFLLRLLHIFSVHKELGPKLVMIGEMMHDLMYFLLILMVFVFSYAISSNSILYPNSPLTLNTVVQIIRKSYWNIYGELFLEEIEGEADCSYNAAVWMNGTQARCPTETGKWLVPIMMGIYMMIANVLLLNLLIAMFSNTFQKVQDNSDKHWHYQLYTLINEYHTRPVFVPPFNLFAHLFLIFRLRFIQESCCYQALKNKCGSCLMAIREHENTGNCFCKKMKWERRLTQWENKVADNFRRNRELGDVSILERKVESAQNNTETIHEQLKIKIPRLESDLTIIKEQVTFHKGGVIPLSPESILVNTLRLENELTNMEKYSDKLDSTQKSQELIISALQYIKTVIENKPSEPVQEALSQKQSRVEETSE